MRVKTKFLDGWIYFDKKNIKSFRFGRKIKEVGCDGELEESKVIWFAIFGICGRLEGIEG